MLMMRLGSPPHTWRIRNVAVNVVAMVRITSTYVENTWHNIYNRLQLLGSPPHTWRIPSTGTVLTGPDGDHLHIRGEYTKQIPLYQ